MDDELAKYRVSGWHNDGSYEKPKTPDLFISHSSRDSEIARKLVAVAKLHGLVSWIAPESVRPTDSYVDQIYAALLNSEVLVLLLTESAIASPYVRREVEVFSEKQQPIIALRMDKCSPGKILTPSPYCFVYDAGDWDFEDLDVGKRFAQMLMQASTKLKLRLMREAKMSAYSPGGKFSWKETFAQASEGIQRRNALLFQREVGENDGSIRAPFEVETVPGAMLRRLLILSAGGGTEDIVALASQLELLGTDCEVCDPEQGNSEEVIAQIEESDGVVVVFDQAATASRPFLSAVERAVERKCLAVVYTGVEVTDKIRFMFATEHVHTVDLGGLGDCADKVHYHLHGEFTQFQKGKETAGGPSSQMSVVGGFLVSLFFGACGLGLAWLCNLVFGTRHGLLTWGGNTFLVSLLISAGIVIEGYFKKLEEPLFLPPEKRFGNRLASTVGATLLFSLMLLGVVKLVGKIWGYEISYWRWVFVVFVCVSAFAVPIVLAAQWKRLKAAEIPDNQDVER